MDLNVRHDNFRCQCYDVHDDFQKIVDTEDTGLIIYRHTSQKEYVRKRNTTANNHDDMFVLHNTKNTEILSADIMEALDKYVISCPRCIHFINSAKRMLKILPKIESNNIMGICDRCRKKLIACIECDKIVKRFIASRSESKDVKQRIKSYISNVNRLLTDLIKEEGALKQQSSTFPDIETFGTHYNSPMSLEETADVFATGATSRRLPRTAPHRDKTFQSVSPRAKKTSFVDDPMKKDAVGTKNVLIYSRSLENITYNNFDVTKTRDANGRGKYEDGGGYNFGSVDSLLQQESTRNRFGQDFLSKKTKIDGKLKIKSSLKDSKFNKSMPEMESKMFPDVSQLSLKNQSEMDFLNAIESAVDGTQYSDFKYYFPKEADVKIKKPLQVISSGELISDTQNMLQEKAEKDKLRQEQDLIRKQEQKERQRLEKVEKAEKKRSLAAEQLKKQKEEAKIVDDLTKKPITESSSISKKKVQATEVGELKSSYSKEDKTGSERLLEGKIVQEKQEKQKPDARSKRDEDLIGQKQDKPNVVSKADQTKKKDVKEADELNRELKDAKDQQMRKQGSQKSKIEKDVKDLRAKSKEYDDRTKKEDGARGREKENITKEEKRESKKSKEDDIVIGKGKEKTDVLSKVSDKLNPDHKVTEIQQLLNAQKEHEGKRKKESKKGKEDDDALKKGKETTRRDEKYETKKSKADEVTDRKDKQKRETGATDKTQNDMDAAAKSGTVMKEKSDTNKERKTGLKEESREPPAIVDNKAAEEFRKLIAEQNKQRELDQKQKKKQEEEDEKKRATAEKKIGDTLKMASTPTKKSAKKQSQTKLPPSQSTGKEVTNKPTPIELSFGKIKMKEPSGDDLLLRLVQIHQSAPHNRLIKSKEESNIKIILARYKKLKDDKNAGFIYTESDIQLELENINRDIGDRVASIIIGEKIHKYTDTNTVKSSLQDKIVGNFKTIDEETDSDNEIEKAIEVDAEKDDQNEQIPTAKVRSKTPEQEPPKGIIRYALSDRSFIEKGWTLLRTEKVVRKMNVYRMRPAHPEFDWFEHNKSKRLMQYDSGEKLAEFDEKGRGRWFYKNGRVALDYYDAEESNTQQRFVIYSSGEPDERGRSRPFTILATFDYLGNGVVFDHAGKIRLKYNQTEGVVLDRSIGPVSHWKWHTLNDPPVLQQVMIDTQMPYKDPNILKLGKPGENMPRPDNEEMLAIEFDNFIKEKSKKLSQTFKPFQIKMKALKINEQFSLKVLDQATVYLIFRDGSANLKLNMGMILDHKEIVDTDTAEVGEVSNSLERLPARTDSIAGMQSSVAKAQHVERLRVERERRLRPTAPSASVDRLHAAASRPLRPPFRTATSVVSDTSVSCIYKCRKPSSSNLYYDTRLV